ncbi:MAG: DNA primase [Gammaproteobacteria bacterium]|nr:MAG: DNA primase [Gammaproteobacteria bacterium]
MKNPGWKAGAGAFNSTKSSANYTSNEDNLGLLLSQLTKVKPNGRGQYFACCPSHNDKSPSLAIRQTDDGKILLKCFSGCSAYEIVSAVGLSLTDLFPPREANHSAPIKNPFPASSVLRCIQSEALIVATAACNMANGAALLKEDRQRLVTAASRIGGAYE